LVPGDHESANQVVRPSDVGLAGPFCPLLDSGTLPRRGMPIRIINTE
jgi:hypothetical protein